MRGLIPVLLLSAVAAASTACGPSVDLTKALKVGDVATGWVDAGAVEGKNKIVPYAAFTLHNQGDRTLGSLQVNVVFRRVNETQDWGSKFLPVAGSSGLAAGATSNKLEAKSELGYTGTDTRPEMLQNSQFVDVKADIFAKYGSTQWTKIAEYPVDRKLVTP
jgi:hypothetical protein